VPAHRSRTQRWRESLEQMIERRGSVEFSVARPATGPGADSPDLIWRVRLLAISENEMLVEVPVAMGRSVTLAPGISLVVVYAVGQNRWMFKSITLGRNDGPSPFGDQPGIRCALPADVHRCPRREYLRTSVASINLPKVKCWPLIDASSAAPAEVANRINILDFIGGKRTPSSADQDMLPEVGPGFTAQLINIGGGGVGLMVPRDESQVAERCRNLWMRIDLTPEIPAPLGVTARVCHTHIDSEGHLYLGVAFEFAYHPVHKEFVVEQITRYVNTIQARITKAA
jgi:hypothetical protein